MSLDRRRYLYRVTGVTRVQDGDTWDLTLTELQPHDPGFNDRITWESTKRFRLIGPRDAKIDVVELRTIRGRDASAFSEAWIRVAIAAGQLEGESFKHDVTTPDGSFGRWLIDLYRVDTGVHLSDVVREAGYEAPPD
jgi:endonuclease YncB( thermonuclease family)